MKTRFAVLFTASLCAFLPSCAHNQAEKTKPDENKIVAEGPKLVGRIASIPADKRFVLIQSYGKWNVGTDQILTTRGPDDRMANLRTTGESLGEFAAADLQSGHAEVGDAVYFQPIRKPSSDTMTPVTPEVPPNQNTPPLENVQKFN
jgi:hypothetical protein